MYSLRNATHILLLNFLTITSQLGYPPIFSQLLNNESTCVGKNKLVTAEEFYRLVSPACQVATLTSAHT